MFFPSLLPMIPGIYAYRAFGALGACIFIGGSPEFGLDFYRFAYNGLVCSAVLLAMVTGATVPVFVFKKYRSELRGNSYFYYFCVHHGTATAKILCQCGRQS